MFWSILAVVALIYIVAMFRALPEQPAFAQIRIWKPRHPKVAIIAGLVGLAGTAIIFQDDNLFDNQLWNALKDLAPEMIGMAFTVVVIDELNQQLANSEEKERLILQMGSPDNTFAVEAVRQLRQRGWLTDGALVGAYLGGAQLSKANLSKANLSEANLIRTILCEALLPQAILTSADLWTANLYGAVLVEAKLNKTNLRRADLGDTNLRQADLSQTNLSHANLENANLLGANLVEANMNKANLSGADLSHANLTGAYLGNANLIDTDLQSANLSDAVFTSAIYNYKTKWPDDFDARAAGAIKTEWVDHTDWIWKETSE